MEIDLDLWLKLTGADKEVNIGDKPDLELLKKLVKYQVKEVWYQNLDLLTTRAEVDLTPTALLNRMLVEGKRGICFEGCELMALVLEGFKFNVKRVETFAMGNREVYQEGAVMTHYMIVVLLDDKKYLVDVMLGFNSIREPLEFSFEKTEERTVIPEAEHYKLEVYNDHCHLHMWLKGSWPPLYRINLPISNASHNQLIGSYRRFLRTTEVIMSRDHILKFGRLTETRKIGFTCQFDTRVMAENFEQARSEKISFKEF